MQWLSVILYTFFILVTLGTVIVIIFDDGDSAKKIAWILVITILPIVGLLLYFMVGINVRQSWFFAQKHRRFIRIFGERADRSVRELLFGHCKDNLVRDEYKQLAHLLATDGSTCVTDGNDVEIITSGKRKFDLLMEDLRNAKDHIHMEYFYFRQDAGSQQIKEMLMQKAREGVKVRFIHENIANIAIRPKYYNEMKKAGVQVEKFTKPRWPLVNLFTQLNYRDHRKIVVIDGKIGYTGGMNISDDYFIRWRDTHLRITGNAVAGLQFSFLNTWITADGEIDPDFGKYFPMCAGNETGNKEARPEVQDGKSNVLVQIVPDEPESAWPIIHMGAVWAVQHAKKYIYIQTPYFVPPEPMMQALQSAALSGVDVRVMVPKKADLFFMGPANRSYFTECLKAGVRIYERAGRFIHSKTFVSDDYLSEIGSANMDFRSFNLDYELNAYLYDEEKARINKEIFEKDMEASTEVTLEEWLSRPWYKKLVQRIIRLFAALL
ncbi:MAG: cardiolipin synthase [Candidatus Cryptobacteroides sp.]